MFSPNPPSDDRGRPSIRRCCALIAASALLQSAAHAAPTPAAAAAPALVREVLPDAVVPSHYDLVISPDADRLVFRGTVSIAIDVRQAVSQIALNAVELEVDHAAVDGGAAATVGTDPRLGRVLLDLRAPLPAGRHRLDIAYHGRIARTTNGFFAMDYAGPDGPHRTLATNFEPAEARRLLPCWDEPGRKATFTVSVDAPPARTVVSNMPVAGITPLSTGLQRVRFAESPRMSTYLLFVGIGDFDRVHRLVDGVDVGVVVKRGDAAKAAYALDEAASLLKFYNGYFGIAYPLPKLDLVAAPGAITGGAMENWGAIFYSQDSLLFDAGLSTERDRQEVFETVSHEMAHQWFGDLVTMAWWDDLWLNEGFARWMQTFAADALHPEWQTGLQAAAVAEAGKRADAVPSTHPVVQPVFTADQAGESFDSITYDKGATVISMLNAYVGPDTFREGVRRYMRRHAFGNTVDADLWRSVQQAVGRPIAGIEHDFTRQEGVPLVRVTVAPRGVHLAQSRFADDPKSLAGLAPQRWRLPLKVAEPGREGRTVLLQGVTEVPATPPLLVNAGQTAYARVLYAPELLASLAAHFGALDPADELGLLYDTRALGLAGYAPPGDLLTLVRAVPPTANDVVWMRVLAMLQSLYSHYGEVATPARTAFGVFALRLLEPLSGRLGDTAAAGEPANTSILRSQLLTVRARLGDPAAIALARERFAAGGGTSAEQRSAVAIVAAHADAATFDALLARAGGSADPLQKQVLFEALAGVSDAGLARRMVEVALGDQVPAGTAPDLLFRLAERHPDLVWEMVDPRIDAAGFPMEKATRWRIAGDIASLSAEPRRIAELEAYEARSVPQEARKPFLESVASIRRNRHILDEVLPQLDRWITAQDAGTGRGR